MCFVTYQKHFVKFVKKVSFKLKQHRISDKLLRVLNDLTINGGIISPLLLLAPLCIIQ